MRFAFFLFALLGVALAQEPIQKQYSNSCPEFEDGPNPNANYWLEGTIGERQVRMHVERGGRVVAVQFYFLDDWRPVTLAGQWKNDNSIDVSDETEQDDATRYLQGDLTTRGFVGTWKTAAENTVYPVRLETTSKPACDGEGSWQTFDDPRWPITFSYPASWHLEADDKNISLTCQDPSLLVYATFGVSLTQTQQPDDVGLDLCGNEWKVSCDEKEARQSPARPTTVHRQDGITILTGYHTEERMYCRGGGYVGQGDGDGAFLSIDGKWVEPESQGPQSSAVTRMIATAKPRH